MVYRFEYFSLASQDIPGNGASQENHETVYRFLDLSLGSPDRPVTTTFLQGIIQKYIEILPKWAPRGVPEWSWRGPWGVPEAPEHV